jgi:hypothetical protein
MYNSTIKKFKDINLFLRYQDYMEDDRLSMLFIPNEYLYQIDKLKSLLEMQTNCSQRILMSVLADTREFTEDNWFVRLMGLVSKYGTLDLCDSGIWIFNRIDEFPYRMDKTCRDTNMYKGLGVFFSMHYDDSCYYYTFDSYEAKLYVKQQFRELHKRIKYNIVLVLNKFLNTDICRHICGFLFEPLYIYVFHDDDSDDDW